MRGYLGLLSFFKVFGRWKVTEFRVFLAFFLKVAPDLTALAVFKACALGSAFFELSAALNNCSSHASHCIQKLTYF